MKNTVFANKKDIFQGLRLLGVAMIAAVLGSSEQAMGTIDLDGNVVSENVEIPPPNVIFLLDLSSAMNQNCCMGMPCLEQVKKSILEVSRHNDWARVGVIGTTSSAGYTYFPIAPVGTPPAELASALASVTVNPSDTRNFGQTLFAVTWQYLRYGMWAGDSSGDGSPITVEDQQTHVITITKALPNNDPLYYSSVASFVYNYDAGGDVSGTQNVVTHTIEIGGYDKNENYSNAAKATDGEGLFLTPITNQELVAGISLILRQIRADYVVKSAALVNSDDNRVYVTQFALEQDGNMPAGDLLQYETDTDPSSPTYGQIQFDESSPHNGARWSAGSLLAAKHVSKNERNGPGKRRLFTYVPELLSCLPGTRSTVTEARGERRMSFDAQFSEDLAGTDCVDLFVKEETYEVCPDMVYDEGNDNNGNSGDDDDDGEEAGPVEAIPSTSGGVCDVTITEDYRTADIKCTKTITQVRLNFGDGSIQTFSNVNKKQKSLAGTGSYLGKKLWGAYVTASSTSERYYENPCFPLSCVDQLNLDGVIRDFTPSTNPDFQRIIQTDYGIVKNDLGADKKPVYNSLVSNPTITSATAFNQWYRDVPGTNLSIPYTITLRRYADTNVFKYTNTAFFPIDDQGFGNYASSGHNYHFTYEIHGSFTYTGGEYFEFTGDDDLFVFINNKLAIDLGGVHSPLNKAIYLDDIKTTLGITLGGTYDIDFFFAERHTVQSNILISTTMVITTEPEESDDKKYVICHVPPGNPGNAHTIIVGKPAVANAHLKNHEGDHVGPCGASDLSGDGVVDHHDVQSVVDFVRGESTSPVKYLDYERGDWKLGSSEHSVPVIVRAETDNFTGEPTYRAFKESIEEAHALGAPDLTIVAANDGMLHAFDVESGEEAWAWVPAQVLYYDQASSSSGRAIESAWYGQTSLFDGTPVVEDLWIDADGDGKKAEDGSEWHRIVIVSQGEGGPATLALDITDTNEPRYLWEMSPDPETIASTQSVSRPLLTYVLDTSGEEPQRVPVAIWGTGEAAAAATPVDNYSSSEASVLMQALGGGFWGDLGSPESGAIVNINPDTSVVSDLDGDGRSEMGYIAGAMSGIDVDGDEALDVLYFPVSVTYEPLDMGDVDGDGLTGTNDVADPGYTWLYKAVINPADPLNPTICEFYDPLPTTGARPEVYYAPTTAWLPDGNLAVYWGTGGPDSRSPTDTGFVYAMVDPAPTSCAGSIPVSNFGDQGVLTLGAGEVLTWDPIIYAGVLYFVTYIPDTTYNTTGSSRIYGLEYDTGNPAIDENNDGRDLSSFVSVDGPIGSLNISDSGVMFYGLSTSTVTDSGSIAVGMLSLVTSDRLNAQPVTWAEMF